MGQGHYLSLNHADAIFYKNSIRAKDANLRQNVEMEFSSDQVTAVFNIECLW